MDNESNQNMESPQKNSTWGPAIGLIIILLLIVAGSLYFFSTSPGTESPTTLEGEINELQEASEEESVDLESDLDDSDLENLDESLEQIESEL